MRASQIAALRSPDAGFTIAAKAWVHPQSPLAHGASTSTCPSPCEYSSALGVMAGRRRSVYVHVDVGTCTCTSALYSLPTQRCEAMVDGSRQPIGVRVQYCGTVLVMVQYKYQLQVLVLLVVQVQGAAGDTDDDFVG